MTGPHAFHGDEEQKNANYNFALCNSRKESPDGIRMQPAWFKNNPRLARRQIDEGPFVRSRSTGSTGCL